MYASWSLNKIIVKTTLQMVQLITSLYYDFTGCPGCVLGAGTRPHVDSETDNVTESNSWVALPTAFQADQNLLHNITEKLASFYRRKKIREGSLCVLPYIVGL
jgi:hypothetical protein